MQQNASLQVYCFYKGVEKGKKFCPIRDDKKNVYVVKKIEIYFLSTLRLRQKILVLFYVIQAL